MRSWDKISMWKANVSKLPDHLKCPKLTFFLMVSKDPSMKIPTNFFQEMKNLKVLTFCRMNFPSLPCSISLLMNLRTLFLDHCVLGDISLIGELKDLEILHFVLSHIEMLPREIGQLTKLKLLDLSDSKLKRIQSGVFCTLSRLEELYMGNSFVQWEAETQQSSASLAELKALSCLSVLDLHIPNANIIRKDLSFENLQRYNIFIGEAWDWDCIGLSKYSRILKFNLKTSFGLLDYGIEFPQLQSLTLEGMPELISFCSRNGGSTSMSPQAMALFNLKILFPKLGKMKLS